jgi:hypothetical protein
VLALAIGIGFVAWLIFKGDDEKKTNTQASGATAVSVADLRALRDSSGHNVYWAGARSGETYELTQTPNGNVFLRYLPSNSDVGAQRPVYLTVGTYPFKRAYQTLQRLSRRKDAVSTKLPSGGIAVASKPDSQNVYFAYPDEDLQIEVFDPRPGRALRLVTSGRIKPIT